MQCSASGEASAGSAWDFVEADEMEQAQPKLKGVVEALVGRGHKSRPCLTQEVLRTVPNYTFSLQKKFQEAWGNLESFSNGVVPHLMLELVDALRTRKGFAEIDECDIDEVSAPTLLIAMFELTTKGFQKELLAMCEELEQPMPVYYQWCEVPANNEDPNFYSCSLLHHMAARFNKDTKFVLSVGFTSEDKERAGKSFTLNEIFATAGRAMFNVGGNEDPAHLTSVDIVEASPNIFVLDVHGEPGASRETVLRECARISSVVMVHHTSGTRGEADDLMSSLRNHLHSGGKLFRLIHLCRKGQVSPDVNTFTLLQRGKQAQLYAQIRRAVMEAVAQPDQPPLYHQFQDDSGDFQLHMAVMRDIQSLVQLILAPPVRGHDYIADVCPVTRCRERLFRENQVQQWDAATKYDRREHALREVLLQEVHPLVANFAKAMSDKDRLFLFGEALRLWQEPEQEKLGQELAEVQKNLNQVTISEEGRQANTQRRAELIKFKDFLGLNTAMLWKELVNIEASIDELRLVHVRVEHIPTTDVGKWREVQMESTREGVQVVKDPVLRRFQPGERILQVGRADVSGRTAEDVGKLLAAEAYSEAYKKDGVPVKTESNQRQHFEQLHSCHLSGLVEPYVAQFLGGYPVEFVDGTTWEVAETFIGEVMEAASERAPRLDGERLAITTEKRGRVDTPCRSTAGGGVLPLAVMGPQSSGKTTLLRHLFGIWGKTAPGRCTTGINISSAKVRQQGENAGLTEDLIIIDTEGCGSVEVTNMLYDRMICLAAMACSHVLMINMGRVFDESVKHMVNVAIWAFFQLQMATPENRPQIIFVMRDYMDTDHVQLAKTQAAVMKSMREFSLNTGIGAKSGDPDRDHSSSFSLADIINEPIWFTMPPAFQMVSHQKVPSDAFVQKTVELREVLMRSLKAQEHAALNHTKWVTQSIAAWRSIVLDGSIMQISNLCKKQFRDMVNRKAVEQATQARNAMEPHVASLIDKHASASVEGFQAEWASLFDEHSVAAIASFQEACAEQVRDAEDEAILEDCKETLQNLLKTYFKSTQRRWQFQVEQREALALVKTLSSKLLDVLKGYTESQLRDMTEFDLDTVFNLGWDSIMREIRSTLEKPPRQVEEQVKRWYIDFTSRNAQAGNTPANMDFLRVRSYSNVLSIDPNVVWQRQQQVKLKCIHVSGALDPSVNGTYTRESRPTKRVDSYKKDAEPRGSYRVSLCRVQPSGFAWFLDHVGRNFFHPQDEELYHTPRCAFEQVLPPMEGWFQSSSVGRSQIQVAHTVQEDPQSSVPESKSFQSLEARALALKDEVPSLLRAMPTFEEIAAVNAHSKLIQSLEKLKADVRQFHGAFSSVSLDFEKSLHALVYHQLVEEGVRRNKEEADRFEAEQDKMQYKNAFLTLAQCTQGSVLGVEVVSKAMRTWSLNAAAADMDAEEYLRERLNALVDAQTLMTLATDMAFPCTVSNVSGTEKFVKNLGALIEEIFRQKWEVAVQAVALKFSADFLPKPMEYVGQSMAVLRDRAVGVAKAGEQVAGDEPVVVSTIGALVQELVASLGIMELEAIGDIFRKLPIQLPTFIDAVQASLEAETLDFWAWLKPYLEERDMFKQYLNQCGGCQAFCPRCGMKCKHEFGHDTSRQKHECVRHLPAAFTGQYFENTMKPNTFICDTVENFDRTRPRVLEDDLKPGESLETTLPFRTWMERYHPDWNVEVHWDPEHPKMMLQAYEALRPALTSWYWSDMSLNYDPPDCQCDKCRTFVRNADGSILLKRGDVYYVPSGLAKLQLTLTCASGGILCGACLRYQGSIFKATTCHCSGSDVAIQHSGDTSKDGRSMHTINIDLEKLNSQQIDRVYLTLCACGPPDLSSFEDPQIWLADNGQKDVNLAEYKVADAGSHGSVVMASLQREGSVWAYNALGLLMMEKCCGNYGVAISSIANKK